MKMPREFYYPKTAMLVRDKQSSAVAAVYEGNGSFYAAMFGGKRSKPDSHYRYRTADGRAKAVSQHFDKIRYQEAAKAARKQKAKTRGLEVGDILRRSWGYDQTNIDFYEVTALIGSSMVEIREIAQDSKETGYMQGKCIPVPESYVGEPIRKRASNGAVRIASYATAYKVEPTVIAGAKVYGSSHWTAYA